MTASGSSVTISSASASTAEFALSGLSPSIDSECKSECLLQCDFHSAGEREYFGESGCLRATRLPQRSPKPFPEPVLLLRLIAWTFHGTRVRRSRATTCTEAANRRVRSPRSIPPSMRQPHTPTRACRPDLPYYYVATSVDGAGAESAFSAVVSASIPTP
jgi:hypothetical protein